MKTKTKREWNNLMPIDEKAMVWEKPRVFSWVAKMELEWKILVHDNHTK